MNYPKISIVTPSFNDVNYIEQTILSVLNQNYPNLEYIIIDGGSTDGTVDIIRKYESQLSYWISEKDNGMYYAIQKGFTRSTGEIMAWINSDDMLHHRGLFTMGQIYNDFPQINWLQGFPNTIDQKDRIVFASSVYEVDKYFFYQKKHHYSYKYIQQESTSWRRSLWEKAGGYVSTEYKLAGDFELWMRFFQYDKLYNTSALIGTFRLSGAGQASIDNYEKYVRETFQILEKYPLNKSDHKKLKYLTSWQKIEDYFLRWNERVRRRLRSDSIVNHKLHFDHQSQSFKLHK